MLNPMPVNDNDPARRSSAPAHVQRAPDRLEAQVRRLQKQAERASLDALAHILAIAAGEAGRMAEWERRVRAELKAGSVNLRSGDR